ncbi:hypothetical protein LCGC14_2938390, partial [marine sediment metagenome]
EIVTRLQGLSGEKYDAAVEAGFVKVLGMCWGIGVNRVTKLRDNGYHSGTVTKAPTAKGRELKAKGSKVKGKTPKANGQGTHKVSAKALKASKMSPEAKRAAREKSVAKGK